MFNDLLILDCLLFEFVGVCLDLVFVVAVLIRRELFCFMCFIVVVLFTCLLVYLLLVELVVFVWVGDTCFVWFMLIVCVWVLYV